MTVLYLSVLAYLSLFVFGRFAAALNDHKLDCWVLSVVPVSGPNTLPVIYDRGLLGVMHDWYCFSPYDQSYKNIEL